MAWQPRQLANLRAALAVVDERHLDAVTAQQVIAGILTECTANNYSNPLYPNTIPLGDGLPPKELAPSTKESCGVFQQRPHEPVWWGKQGLTLEQQAAEFMDVGNAVGLFLDRLVAVPRTTQPWREIQQVQGSEYDGRPGYPYAANYHDNWATAATLLAALRAATTAPATPTIMEWIQTMTAPDQSVLDAFAQDIAQRVEKVLRAFPGESAGQTLSAQANRVAGLQRDVGDITADLAPIKGYGTDPSMYPYTQVIEAMTNRVYETQQSLSAVIDTLAELTLHLAELTGKVDNL